MAGKTVYLNEAELELMKLMLRTKMDSPSTSEEDYGNARTTYFKLDK